MTGLCPVFVTFYAGPYLPLTTSDPPMTGPDQPLTKSGPPMAKPISLLLRSLNGKALILTILGPPLTIKSLSILTPTQGLSFLGLKHTPKICLTSLTRTKSKTWKWEAHICQILSE